MPQLSRCYVIYNIVIDCIILLFPAIYVYATNLNIDRKRYPDLSLQISELSSMMFRHHMFRWIIRKDSLNNQKSKIYKNNLIQSFAPNTFLPKYRNISFSLIIERERCIYGVILKKMWGTHRKTSNCLSRVVFSYHIVHNGSLEYSRSDNFRIGPDNFDSIAPVPHAPTHNASIHSTRLASR